MAAPQATDPPLLYALPSKPDTFVFFPSFLIFVFHPCLTAPATPANHQQQPAY